jgi:superfamily II DNA helicase RecQ
MALQKWIDKRMQVIVIINALKLGINVPDVQLVLYVEPSFDILNYR